MVDRSGRDRGLPLEAVLVWVLFAVVTCEVFVTYTRLPRSELYHVSGTGLAGGASRVVVFWNWPTALVALALLLLLFERLHGWLSRATAMVAAVLCLAVVWPGVVSQANLDAKPVNALSAVGVGLTLVLTLLVGRAQGVQMRRWRRLDWGRLGVSLVLLVVASPWIAADLGFFLNGVPVLGRLFQTGTYIRAVAGLPPFLPAVHHGHHHGMDGFLFVVSALLLSRAVRGVRSRGLQSVLAGYLSLMVCYGLGNMANDFWIEQVFKRHWTAWQIPSVFNPSFSVAWLIIVAGAIAIFALTSRYRRPVAATVRAAPANLGAP